MATETNIHRESRLAKLNTLTEKGYNPYPYCFKPDAYAADLQEKYKDLPAGENTEDRVTVAGRAMAVRNSGMFIDLKDKSGKIQIFCHKSHLDEAGLDLLKCLDVGDLVGVSGFVRRTPRGEFTPPGAPREATTKPTLASNVRFMNFYPFEDLDLISPRPVLFITGSEAHSREFSEEAYRRASEPKRLLIIPGANHVDLYDRTDLIPFDDLNAFFKAAL